MKYSRKSYGVLPKIIHSPASYCVSGSPAAVSAAVREENGRVPDSLTLLVRAGGRYVMDPADSIETDAGCYEIYTAEVPSSEICGSFFSYAIAEEGLFSDVTDFYTVPVIAAESIPALPPLCLTEVYARPKIAGNPVYLEVMNPGKEPVDLYGYEFLVFTDTTEPSGEPVLRLPMANAPGCMLGGGEFTAVWWITPKNYGVEGRDYTTPADFADMFNGDFNNRENRVSTDGSDGRKINVTPVSITIEDPATGVKSFAPGTGEFPIGWTPGVIAIVPRGKTGADALFRVVYNTVFGSWDTPVKHSSYWVTDPLSPGKGVAFAHSADPTPGFPGPGQAIPDLTAPLPVIIPVCPIEKVYLGDGDCDISFAAVAMSPDRPAVSASVSTVSGGRVTVWPAQEREDGLFHASVPIGKIEFEDKLSYFITVGDGSREVFFGRDDPVTVPVLDNAGPRITSMIPTEKYCYDLHLSPEIRMTWTDRNGTDTDRCRLEIDGKNMTSSAVWKDGSVSLPIGNLSAGAHRLEIDLFDRAGNRTGKKVNFGISDMSELSVYVGEVHSHTSDSDGTGMPEDAYRYARDTGGVDFFAVTEHSHYLDDSKFARGLKIADSFDEPGKFAALYGFEMTWHNLNGYWGHANVLNTADYLQNPYKNSLPDLYEWLADRPEGVGMFNHPGVAWGDFEEFGFISDRAVKAMSLAEIKGPSYDFEYSLLLSKGWKASPVTNEDNHKPNWTTASPMTGCVLAPALTRQNIVDSFKAGRTYTTSDRTMKILYRLNGAWMGSEIVDPDVLRFSIDIKTENTLGIGLVEIIAEDGIVVASRNAGVRREFLWEPELPPLYDYYYVRVTGAGRYCVTAPVRLKNGRRSPKIEKLTLNASYNDTDTVAASVSLSNPGQTAINDLRVAFYLTPQGGFREGEYEPFRTLHIGKLKGHCRATVSCLVPEVPHYRRLSVILTGIGENGKKLSSTRSVMLSSVRIAEILPDSSDETVDGKKVSNPYPYVTLYNSSTQPVSLAGGRLVPWTATGRMPPEAKWIPTDGIVIPGRSAAVIWDRSRCPSLTAGDFNRRYGLSLTEGKDLFPTSVRMLDSSTDGRKLELRIGGETVSRACWNTGLFHTGTRQPDKALEYVYIPNMTSTLTFKGYSDPTPDSVDEEQRGVEKVVVPGKAEKKLAKKAEEKDRKAAARNKKLRFTAGESAGIALGAAAAVGAAVGSVMKIIGGRRKK
ncbi:MAG: hypothetical protein K5647_08240 [Clostridiales bacterium]|nr:hypothetical protein [Clostridiales bacterium]